MPPPTPSFWQLLQGLLGPTAPPSVPRGDIVLPSPREPASEPPLAALAPWLEGGTELIRGAAGLGDQGPAGPTWLNAGALLSALPLTSLPSLGRGLFSRVDDVLRQIPAKGIHPNKIASLLRSGATAEEAAYRGIPEFLASKGNALVTPGELQAHLAQHPAPFPQVKTLGDAPTELIAQQDALSKQIDIYRAAAFDEPRDWVGVPRVDQMNARHWAIEAQPGAVAPERQAQALEKLEKVVADPDHLQTILHYGKLAQESKVLNEQRLAQYPRPKYAQYQVPGGEQYRETLLTLPPKSALTFEDYAKDYRLFNPGASDEAARKAYNRMLLGDTSAKPPDVNVFKSSHFDEPNVLVHTRQNERVLPTGERGRFLEEIQSDWHQKGKAGGYALSAVERAPLEAERALADKAHTATADALSAAKDRWKYGTGDPVFEALDTQERALKQQMGPARDLWRSLDPSDPMRAGVEKDYSDLQRALQEVEEQQLAWRRQQQQVVTAAEQANEVAYARYKTLDDQLRAGVPDAPFKDLWPDLALKQQLLDTAQDPKLSWLGVTGGKTQAARYDLSKQVSHIDYKDIGGGQYKLGVVGKDGEPIGLPRSILKRDELADVVGKEVADKIVAGEGQPGGGRMTLRGLDLQVGGEGMKYFYDKLVPSRLEKLVKPFGGKVEPMTVPGTTDQGWMVRLTPEMKARILKEGLPLLTVPLAVLGAHAGASEKR